MESRVLYVGDCIHSVCYASLGRCLDTAFPCVLVSNSSQCFSVMGKQLSRGDTAKSVGEVSISGGMSYYSMPVIKKNPAPELHI